MSTALMTRKSVYALNSDEVLRLRNAFTALYNQPIAGQQSLVSKYANSYQEQASILITYGHYQRNDLLFLPWVRAYIHSFEQALQTVDATLTMPYWDYTSTDAIKRGIPPLLADTTYEDNGKELPNPLYQANYKFPLQTFRAEQAETTALKAAVPLLQNALAETSFVDFSLAIYQVDIASHIYIGGSAKNTETTAYDPIFWFTHCQLDHFWAQWQGLHADQQVPSSVLSATLQPFWAKASDAKASFLTGQDVSTTSELGYVYA